MFNVMVSLIIPIIARTARIACADRHTDIQDNYRNLRWACALRVNKGCSVGLEPMTHCLQSRCSSNGVTEKAQLARLNQGNTKDVCQ